MEFYDRWVIGIGSLAIGLILGLYTGVQWRRAKASSRWPSTKGEILDSSANCSDEWYRLKIKYRYSVNGREYRRNRVNFHGVGGRQDVVESYVARFPQGASVPVFYNPESPRISCLETGIGSVGPWLFVAFGTAILFVTGLVVLCYGFATVAEQFGKYFFAICFPSICLTGACVLWIGWRRGKASANWPSTTGEILRANIAIRDGSYSPKVQYRYCVGGRLYNSDNLTYRSYYTDRETAEAYISRFPTGARIYVYYDPERPARATLEVGNGPLKHILMAICVLAGLISFSLAIWIWGV